MTNEKILKTWRWIKARSIIIFLTIGSVALAVISVMVYAATRRSSGSTSTININQHQRELENKIEIWERYLAETPAPRRRG